jgi:translation initiation factor IF-1
MVGHLPSILPNHAKAEGQAGAGAEVVEEDMVAVALAVAEAVVAMVAGMAVVTVVVAVIVTDTLPLNRY